MEYHEIPGITLDNRLLEFQKYVANAKKAKTTHLGCGTSSEVAPGQWKLPRIFPTLCLNISHLVSTLASGISREVADRIMPQIRTLAQGPLVKPDLGTYRGYINDLEIDRRNTEFRLQFLYNHYESLLSILSQAKQQEEELKLLS
jgi:hypothetical protein